MSPSRKAKIDFSTLFKFEKDDTSVHEIKMGDFAIRSSKKENEVWLTCYISGKRSPMITVSSSNLEKLSEQHDNQEFLRNFMLLGQYAKSFGEAIQEAFPKEFPLLIEKEIPIPKPLEKKEKPLEVKDNTINLSNLFAFKSIHELKIDDSPPLNLSSLFKFEKDDKSVHEVRIGDFTIKSQKTSDAIWINCFGGKPPKRLDQLSQSVSIRSITEVGSFSKTLSEQKTNKEFLQALISTREETNLGIANAIQEAYLKQFPKKSSTSHEELEMKVSDLTIKSTLKNDIIRINFSKDGKPVESEHMDFPLSLVKNLKTNEEILNFFSTKGSSIIQKQFQQSESVALLLNKNKLNETKLQERSLYTKEDILSFIKTLPDKDALSLIEAAFNKETPLGKLMWKKRDQGLFAKEPDFTRGTLKKLVNNFNERKERNINDPSVSSILRKLPENLKQSPEKDKKSSHRKR
jgi:hypothetical protein